MLRPVLLGAALCLLLIACGKIDKPTPPPATPTTAAAPLPQTPPAAAVSQPALTVAPANPTPVSAPAATSTPLPTSDPAAALSAMTQALRKYSAEKQRVPATLGEVVAAGYLQSLPQPPPGNKYSIDPGAWR